MMMTWRMGTFLGGELHEREDDPRAMARAVGSLDRLVERILPTGHSRRPGSGRGAAGLRRPP
ncbi:hypothetical protein FRIGORI9N_470200 [Frigoribacterium sp. 9N]|nr:hypothetical protein FRIGORI9N_470200 [Frigoribacterium sp. 9N]